MKKVLALIFFLFLMAPPLISRGAEGNGNSAAAAEINPTTGTCYGQSGLCSVIRPPIAAATLL